jgi:uncharacterized protein involved in response to NO
MVGQVFSHENRRLAPMKSPARHPPEKGRAAPRLGWGAWLASDPFRVFFLSGAVWSLIGVSLWPLFYSGQLTFYPGISHARLMIESFGGAFVVGFLGTAGPRMANAPRLSIMELGLLFGLHTANGVCHLKLMPRAGDWCFVGMLGLLLAGLLARMVRFRQEPAPPQLLLAMAGLLCGITGALMFQSASASASPWAWRLAGLLLYQGLLLPPVLGIGAFLFPRILGGRFGDAATPQARCRQSLRAAAAAILIVVSFFLESGGAVIPGYLLRAGAAAAYLLGEIPWRHRSGDPPRGTLTRGLFWAMGLGMGGLVAASLFSLHRVAMEHLLYIGGFGLLMLIVGSRVLFGHSGDLAGFEGRRWSARLLLLLVVLAATTRASAAIKPEIMVSHHNYAAGLWAVAILLWTGGHARRFFRRDES